MSSEDNKSKSEEINKFLQQNQDINSLSNNIKDENPSKEKPSEQELESQKKIEQKEEKILTKNSNTKKNKSLSPPIKFQSAATEFNSSLIENKKTNFFKSKKINLFEKKENCEKFCCNCTKTKCIKKYCECFANNRYCKDCNCIDCLNKPIYSSNNNNSSKDFSENEEIFCTCTKSNCNKKYCECYKSNKKCNDKCRCSNCLNSSYPIFNIKNKDTNSKENNSKENISDNDINNSNELISNKPNIELDENKSNSRKSSLNGEGSENSEESYQIQRISVFISQYQTLVNVEKFTKEDMKLLSKKRVNNK